MGLNTTEERRERISLLDNEFEYWHKRKKGSKDSTEIFECKEEMNIQLARLKFVDQMEKEIQIDGMFGRKKIGFEKRKKLLEHQSKKK